VNTDYEDTRVDEALGLRSTNLIEDKRWSLDFRRKLSIVLSLLASESQTVTDRQGLCHCPDHKGFCPLVRVISVLP
jgi:hypothetical protein